MNENTTDAILEELKELARSMMHSITKKTAAAGGHAAPWTSAGGGGPSVKVTKSPAPSARTVNQTNATANTGMPSATSSSSGNKGAAAGSVGLGGAAARSPNANNASSAAMFATSGGGGGGGTASYAAQQAFIETVNRRAQHAYEQLQQSGSLAASQRSPQGQHQQPFGPSSVPVVAASHRDATNTATMLTSTAPASGSAAASAFLHTTTRLSADTTAATATHTTLTASVVQTTTAGRLATAPKSVPTPLNASSIASEATGSDSGLLEAALPTASDDREHAACFDTDGADDADAADFDVDEGDADDGDIDVDDLLDGSTFDHVRTLVVFLKADEARYHAISQAMWQPEDVDTAHGAVQTVMVPSFPLGGGITDSQDRRITANFADLVAAERAHRTARPALLQITHAAFQDRAFEDVTSASAAMDVSGSGWGCRATTDFVVQLDAAIVFDAIAAKATRREQRLAEQQEHRGLHAGEISLRVLMDPLRTGFEEEKEFPIVPGSVVAGRYRILDLLGQATFSRAVRCHDLEQPIYEEDDEAEEEEDEDFDASNDEDAEDGSKRPSTRADAAATKKKKTTKEPTSYHEVCLKIINNTKEFFDQSLDEIRLLQLINSVMDPDEAHVVRLVDYFYHKEHMFLVTELLSDNLYEFSKYDREHDGGQYFTLTRLQSITRQITEALAYIHSLDLLHCDLKPENILFQSHRRCIVKVIDFGSSCFTSDHLSSYIQSRSYRAPEVILGADYDGRIDVWSLGAILAELVTGDVLFAAETVTEMLARIVATVGSPLPRSLLWEGRHTHDFVTKFGAIYEIGNKDRDENAEESFYLYTPVFATHDTDGNAVEDTTFVLLRNKLAASGMTDPLFLSFVEACLELDHKKRQRSDELLKHPFLHASYDE